MRDKIENTLEYSMFASRWLMAPVYVVLCLSLAFIMLKVLQEFAMSIYYFLKFEESKNFILDLFKSNFSNLDEFIDLKDAKSKLQEVLQAEGSELPEYSVIANKEGNKFNCTVIFNGETFQASAALKKESEQKVSELILKRVYEL